MRIWKSEKTKKEKNTRDDYKGRNYRRENEEERVIIWRGDKLQRIKRKISEKPQYSKTSFKFMKISWTFYFVIRVVNILIFCYIYEN